MDDFIKVQKKAEKLVYQLALMIDNGRRKICENYGEQEVRKFRDSAIYLNLRTDKQHKIDQILEKVSFIGCNTKNIKRSVKNERES